jgi:hypothetical protein
VLRTLVLSIWVFNRFFAFIIETAPHAHFFVRR